MATPSQPGKDAPLADAKKVANVEASSSTNPLPREEKPSKELTPEEQMARYEDDLKETDWGHQPC